MDTPSHTHHHVDAQCPSCRLHELVPINLARAEEGRWKRVAVERREVQIDACPVCNGAWFDAGELNLLAGETANIEQALDPTTRPTHRQCPRGCGSMSERDLHGAARTPVDHCSKCGGIWLDGHERHKLAKSTTREGQEDRKTQLKRRGAIWAVGLLVQMPVEVENPVNKTPWVVIAALISMVLGFLMEQAGLIEFVENCAPGANGLPGGAMVGDLVDGATIRELCLAPIGGALRDQWVHMGVGALTLGSYYTLGTYWLLHGGWLHLLGNAYFLYIFGDNVETLFGRVRFAVFFLICVFASGLAEVWLGHSTQMPIVGASGGIAGVMAAYLWCFPRSKLFQVILFIQLKLPVWVYLLGWVGLQLIMGLELFGEQLGVAWFAHLFGFIAGAAMTPLILGQRRKEVAAQVKVPARQLGMI